MTGIALSSAALGYLTEVSAALGDLDQTERGELLDEVQEHLHAIVDETPGHDPSMDELVARLGTPNRYAAELRSAAGLHVLLDASQDERTEPLRALSGLAERLPEWHTLQAVLRREAWAYVVRLRPAWWLLRGYLAAGLIVLETAKAPQGYSVRYSMPYNPQILSDMSGHMGWVVVTLAVTAASVVIGLGSERNHARVRAVAWFFNVAAVVALATAPIWYLAPGPKTLLSF